MITEPAPHKPFVPSNVQMKEFTFRAVLLGIFMCVILGFANAYLGLRAGITIAATYPAAVIGMAVLRIFGGTILEENLARTAGSIGESVAAGAIFTIPAFLISKTWASFDTPAAYWKSTVLMMTGAVLGVLFVSLMRRAMVEDPELPFPESVAAAEIHKAGQGGSQAAKYLFYNMGFGAIVYFLGALKLYPTDTDFRFAIGQFGRSSVRLGPPGTTNVLGTGGFSLMSMPSVSPAYFGVGYIIGPRLASLNFAGGVFAWGLMVPLLIYFLGPQLKTFLPPDAPADSWDAIANSVWRYVVRPIAVGGMLVGAASTLFKMRKNLTAGLGRAFRELRQSGPQEAIARTDRYMNSKTVFALIALVSVPMGAIYIYFSGQVLGGLVATAVMLIVGFFFAAVSGSLVGFIGSTNNPISGLTLSTVIIAALLMVTLGVSGTNGVAAVLGVAAVVCVSSAVAGELFQDFKAGYILGGTPRTIQIVELIAVLCASAVMYFPLLILHQGNINAGGIGFGDRQLSAPQAGLMAAISQGIVGGDMPWPLVVVGIMFGIALIMAQVKSPMLFAVGMYLPFATTFAIFVGGVMKWVSDSLRDRHPYNAGQKARIENIGILVASGLIAGEALVGLVVATFNFAKKPLPEIFAQPSPWSALIAMAVVLFVIVSVPLSHPGHPDEPPPPTAIV